MLPELSLNVLDIANNSIRAGADLVTIQVRIHKKEDLLSIKISDNGCGMTKDQLSRLRIPSYIKNYKRQG